MARGQVERGKVVTVKPLRGSTGELACNPEDFANFVSVVGLVDVGST